MQKAGYIPIATFVLPENCWTEHVYYPQISAQKNFLKKYVGDKTAEELIANQRHEAKLYYKSVLSKIKQNAGFLMDNCLILQPWHLKLQNQVSLIA